MSTYECSIQDIKVTYPLVWWYLTEKVPFKGNTRKKGPCKEPIMQVILSFFPLIFYVDYLKIKDR